MFVMVRYGKRNQRNCRARGSTESRRRNGAGRPEPELRDFILRLLISRTAPGLYIRRMYLMFFHFQASQRPPTRIRVFNDQSQLTNAREPVRLIALVRSS